VHIIYIAVGVQNECQEVVHSISSVAFQKTMVFAATNNSIQSNGRFGETIFPARGGEVIAVGSANGHGLPSPFTPVMQDSYSPLFLALGEDVESFSTIDGMLIRKSGCEYAAAFATGVSALVVDFILNPANNERSWSWENLRRHFDVRPLEVMRRLFSKSLCRGQVLMPWIILEDTEKYDAKDLRLLTAMRLAQSLPDY
jgi:hypothetical protein